MSKVTITLDNLRTLVTLAKRNRTESAGLDLAVEFAAAAVDRVEELERNGYVLAMRVAQSRLLAELDDTELSAMQAFVPALRGEEGGCATNCNDES